MKRTRSRIPLSFMSIIVMAAGVYATCVPTYQEVILWQDSCDRDINPHGDYLERHRNYITWPDSVSTHVESDGYGACNPVPGFENNNCYPYFGTPVTSETRWQQTVTDQQFSDLGGGYATCEDGAS